MNFKFHPESYLIGSILGVLIAGLIFGVKAEGLLFGLGFSIFVFIILNNRKLGNKTEGQ